MAHMFGLYLVSRSVRAWPPGPDYKEQTNKPLPFYNRCHSFLIDMGFVFSTNKHLKVVRNKKCEHFDH